MATTTIDPLKHSAVIAGHTIVGVADATWFSVEQGAEAAVKWVGAKGDTIFVFSADRSASVTIRLKPDSPSNIFLHRMADSKMMGPFEFRDMNNVAVPTLIRSANAVVGSRPAAGRGSEVTPNEWVILLDVTQQEV